MDRLIAASDKSIKGAGSGHVNHLNFGGTNHISGTAETKVVQVCIPAEARVAKFCMQVKYIKNIWMTDYPSRRVQGHVISNFWEMSDNISEMVQDRDMVTMKSKSKSYVAYQMGTVANAIE